MKKLKQAAQPAPAPTLHGRRVCGTCYHFERFPDADQTPGEDIHGECLRKPPKVHGLDETGAPIQSQPVVTHWHRCGDHTNKVN